MPYASACNLDTESARDALWQTRHLANFSVPVALYRACVVPCPKDEMTRRPSTQTRLRILSILILLIVSLVIGGLIYLRNNRCVLALRGTNATLTITGWRAQAACDRIMAQLGVPVSQWPGMIRVRAAYVPSVLCQSADGLTTYIVNGQPAAYGGMGLQLCRMQSVQEVYPGDYPPDKDAIDFFPR